MLVVSHYVFLYSRQIQIFSSIYKLHSYTLLFCVYLSLYFP